MTGLRGRNVITSCTVDSSEGRQLLPDRELCPVARSEGCRALPLRRMAIVGSIVFLLLIFACATPQPPDLWLGGDLFYGDRDPAALLEPLAPLVEGARGYVNLEGPADRSPGGGAASWTDADGRVHLHNTVHGITPELGLLAVGVANNHRLDAADPDAADRALIADGVAALGASVVHLGALRVAMVQVDLAPDLPPTFAAEAAKLRAQADALVVAFHVRGVASYLPSPALRTAVSAAEQAGAGVVVAHGTHAIGPVERRGGMVIAWGLGNVAMACDCTRETDAILLRVRFTPEGKVEHARVLPIRAGLQGAPAQPSTDPRGILDLLTAIGSTPVESDGSGGSF